MTHPTNETAEQAQIEQLVTAVTQARSDEQAEKLIHALIQLGQAYMQSGDVPKGLTQFEEALALAQQGDDKFLEARLWGYKGMALARLGNSHFAQIALYKSQKMASALGRQSLVIDALTQLGRLQLESGQETKAIAKLEQAFGIAMNEGEPERAMNLAGQLGDIFLHLESLEKASEYYGMALHQAQTLGEKGAECRYQLCLGDVCLTNQEVDAAIEYFEAALTLADELDNVQAQISVLNHLLQTYIASDKASLALIYGDHAIRLANDSGDPLTEINSINLLTAYLLEKGNYKKALSYLKRGQNLAVAKEDWAWQLSMLTNLGLAYYHLDEVDAAQDAYLQAWQLATQLQDEKASAYLNGRLGAIEAEKGQFTAAIQRAEAALALAQELEDVALIGEQQILLAFTYHELAQPEQAAIYCQEAINTFTEMGDAETATKARQLLQEINKS